ncbi:hypothetical protein JZU71_03800 [bacterium]|nr:hypothetical protein [bacterium]
MPTLAISSLAVATVLVWHTIMRRFSTIFSMADINWQVSSREAPHKLHAQIAVGNSWLKKHTFHEMAC